MASAHTVEPALRGEGLEVDHPPTGADVAEQIRDARDVVGRDAHNDRFLFTGRTKVDATQQVGRQVAMAQHGGFWLGRGPAGVQQHRHRFGIVGPRRRIAGPFSTRRPPLRHGNGVACRCRLQIGDDQRVRMSREQPSRRVTAKAVVQRNQRDACPCGGEQRHREVVGVDAHIDEFLGVALHQEAGSGMSPVEEGGIGQSRWSRRGRPQAPDADPAGHPCGRHFQQRQNIHRPGPSVRRR